MLLPLIQDLTADLTIIDTGKKKEKGMNMGFNANRFFKSLGSAPIGIRGNFLPWLDAEYTGRIERMTIADRSGSFVVEFTVETSSTPEVQPGQRRTWIQSTKDEDIATSAMAGFALAMMGVDITNKNEIGLYQPYCEAFIACGVSDENPLCGEPFHLFTAATKTKSGGNFTRHNWIKPENGKGVYAWTQALDPVMRDLQAQDVRQPTPVRPAAPSLARPAAPPPRAPVPPPPPPPPPAAKPWDGQPQENGHYWNGTAWIPIG